ncbi:hypothetical protein QO002_000768 [Pararhizobium capsulatum DSM 1112]|uniref:Uncharacterized protein n=1 Tax=Pararhizobium capsulatum DSM 1112 TaxID=1121113 RepID=A0ABU0BK46_9HYPH|nr:hypothetical protein [Pararhizobium capsulatum]MDQ0318630.1 hypothetical protein [Pararhizobium capsulatum DSM 1112]
MKLPKILLIAPPPVLEQGFAAKALIGAAAKSQELAGYYEQIATAADVDFFDAGSVISVDPLDGVRFSAESNVKLGEALATKFIEILGLNADDGWRELRRPKRADTRNTLDERA